MELITYFNFLSKWRVQKDANENPPPKFFIGFAASQAALDHSTLTFFRERLFKRSKLKVSKAILEENFRMALSSGVQFGVIQIVHDPDARCRVKHKRKAKTKDGQEVEHTKATRIHLIGVLVDIHARDYACEDEEPKPDVLGMPSHILNSDSNPIAALSLAGPTRAIAPENKVTWSSLIIYAAAGIRYRLGYSHKIIRRVGNV
jgi:hypothetical protein